MHTVTADFQIANLSSREESSLPTKEQTLVDLNAYENLREGLSHRRDVPIIPGLKEELHFPPKQLCKTMDASSLLH